MEVRNIDFDFLYMFCEIMSDKNDKCLFWSENEIIDCDYLKPIERLLYLVLWQDILIIKLMKVSQV